MSHLEQTDIRSLWKVSWPMMLSYLSTTTMIFVDRIFLAQYSLGALAAAANAGTLSWAFTYGFHVLTEKSEVIVAQRNGAKQFAEIGSVIWQMILLSFLSFLVFFPLAYWGTPLFFSHSNNALFQQEYFSWMTYPGPFYGFLGALIAFYVGRGKTAMVTLASIIGNLVNIILDPILIFGLPRLQIPSMGAKGAAIATGIGVVAQVVFLSLPFLSAYSRQNFGTLNIKICKKTLSQCVKIGLAPACFFTLEVAAWAFFYFIMEEISELHIFVAALCQSVFTLLFFWGNGLQKGIASIGGNLFGAEKSQSFPKLIVSAIQLNFIFTFFTLLVFTFFSDDIFQAFIELSQKQGSQSILFYVENSEKYLELKSLIKIGFLITLLELFLENLRCIFSGLLSAAGDTMFIMISGTFCIWFFLFLPTYCLYLMQVQSIVFFLLIWILFAFTAFSLYLFRYWQGIWKNKKVLLA